MYCLRDWGRFIVSIGSLCPERFGKSEKFFKKIMWLSCLSHPKTKKQRDCLCFGLVWEYGYACLKRPRLFLKMHSLNWILCFAPKVVSLIILYYTGWESVMSTLTIYFRKRAVPEGDTHFFYKRISWITAICPGLIWILRFYYKNVFTIYVS